MKTLEAMLTESMTILRDRPGLTTNYSGPGLLPRGEEAFDWRAVRARMVDHERRESEAAKGFPCPLERARREARADVWNTAAAEIEAEAKRKGLA